jgi:hypothetical protein
MGSRSLQPKEIYMFRKTDFNYTSNNDLLALLVWSGNH